MTYDDGPARGCVAGCVVGALLWTAGAVVAWLIAGHPGL